MLYPETFETSETNDPDFSLLSALCAFYQQLQGMSNNLGWEEKLLKSSFAKCCE